MYPMVNLVYLAGFPLVPASMSRPYVVTFIEQSLHI